MYFSLDDNSVNAIAKAAQYSHTFGHPAVYIDHLVLGLTTVDSPHVNAFFKKHRVNPTQLVKDVAKCFKPLNFPKENIGFSFGIDRVIEQSVVESKKSNSEKITPDHLLLGVLWHGCLLHSKTISHIPSTYPSWACEISKNPKLGF